MRASKRISKEREKFLADPDIFELRVDESEPHTWMMSFTGVSGTLYAGEKMTLRVKFTDDYPMDSPEVVFALPSPVHPHIYSNGHICLNILGEDWSPALTVKSVCMSILSMLSSCEKKEYPPDNARYVVSKPVLPGAQFSKSDPKRTRFVYHDDDV